MEKNYGVEFCLEIGLLNANRALIWLIRLVRTQSESFCINIYNS
jgi:hypothetical protein